MFVLIRLILISLLCLGIGGCAPSTQNSNANNDEHDEPAKPLRIKARWPHDPQSFTQGLIIDGPILYESTGEYGHSRLRRIDWRTGRVLADHALPTWRFGEGLARLDNRLYQLTWKAGQGLIYEPDSLAPLGDFAYAGQGWGLTTDGQTLIMSNGSSALLFLSPDDFHVLRRLTVREQGRAVDRLNELEYIDGRIWANIWHSDEIVVIAPSSGQVIVRLNAHGLREALCANGCAREPGVLNGIAFDPAHRRLMLTGKHWPAMFEVVMPALEPRVGDTLFTDTETGEDRAQ